MKVVQCYSSFFSVEEGKNVVSPISLKEIKIVLEGFAKTKSPGLNG